MAALQTGHDGDVRRIDDEVTQATTCSDGVCRAAAASDSEAAHTATATAAHRGKVNPAVVAQAVGASDAHGATVSARAAAARDYITLKTGTDAPVQQDGSAITDGTDIGAAIGQQRGCTIDGNNG